MNLEQITDTKIFNDVIVEEYRNGHLQKTYSSQRLNIAGLSSLAVYGLFIILAFSIGIFITVFAPGYMYLTYYNLQSTNKSKSIMDPTNLLGLVKLKMTSKISRITGGFVYALLIIVLGIIYMGVSLAVFGFFIDEYPSYSLSTLVPLVLAMTITSSVLYYVSIPVMRKESAFDFMMYNFENHFQGVLVSLSAQLKDIISKHGKNSEEYKNYIESTVVNFYDLSNQRFNDPYKSQQFSVFLYTFLMSVKGKVYGVETKISPILVAFVSIIIMSALGKQIIDLAIT